MGITAVTQHLFKQPDIRLLIIHHQDFFAFRISGLLIIIFRALYLINSMRLSGNVRLSRKALPKSYYIDDVYYICV